MNEFLKIDDLYIAKDKIVSVLFFTRGVVGCDDWHYAYIKTVGSGHEIEINDERRAIILNYLEGYDTANRHS